MYLAVMLISAVVNSVKMRHLWNKRAINSNNIATSMDNVLYYYAKWFVCSYLHTHTYLLAFVLMLLQLEIVVSNIVNRCH